MSEGYDKFRLGGGRGLLGRPTTPSVKLMIEKWPSLKAGDEVTYKDIEMLIKLPRTDSHYRSVVESWKKHMRSEQNIEFGAIDNVGYIVLDDHERINFASGKLSQGMRRVVRAGDIAMTTDKVALSPEELKKADHLVGISATIRSVQVEHTRKLRFELKQIVGQSK